MECRRGLAMRIILCVRLSLKRMHCDKTEERSVQISTSNISLRTPRCKRITQLRNTQTVKSLSSPRNNLPDSEFEFKITVVAPTRINCTLKNTRQRGRPAGAKIWNNARLHAVRAYICRRRGRMSHYLRRSHFQAAAVAAAVYRLLRSDE